MENGDALYARIAELEKENEELKFHNKRFTKPYGDALFARIAEMEKENAALRKAFEIREHKCDSEWSYSDEDEDSEEEEEVLEDLTCAQLKQRLRAINKPVGGRKADLIQRIREHERLTAALFEED